MSLTLDLSKFKKLSREKMKKVVTKTSIDLGQAVVMGTPVDTGRLRGNWMPSLNAYDASTTDDTDKSGTETSLRIETKFKGYKIGDTLTMSNNLPYAVPIEYGHSKIKAPKGMVRVNITKFQKFVNAAARGIK